MQAQNSLFMLLTRYCSSSVITRTNAIWQILHDAMLRLACIQPPGPRHKGSHAHSHKRTYDTGNMVSHQEDVLAHMQRHVANIGSDINIALHFVISSHIWPCS
jgi:hypothetical protein